MRAAGLDFDVWRGCGGLGCERQHVGFRVERQDFGRVGGEGEREVGGAAADIQQARERGEVQVGGDAGGQGWRVWGPAGDVVPGRGLEAAGGEG